MPSLQVSLPLVKLTPLARKHWLLWTECVIRQDGHTRLTVLAHLLAPPRSFPGDHPCVPLWAGALYLSHHLQNPTLPAGELG